MMTRFVNAYRRALVSIGAALATTDAVAATFNFDLPQSDAYMFFSLLIALVIVVLLWHAIDEGPADERTTLEQRLPRTQKGSVSPAPGNPRQPSG
ncbi:MAG TPA: hypothetical protein VNG69_08915 [Casimicrobiaceae bacterium]|nr:hypothetical protein [Casimicrobiaceae bacterium]